MLLCKLSSVFVMCCCFLSAKLRLFARFATNTWLFIAKYFVKLTDCTVVILFGYKLKVLRYYFFTNRNRYLYYFDKRLEFVSPS